jgi:hypothetical protein
MDIVVYAVAILLLGSVILFVKAALFDHRPQKIGLLYALLAVPLYLVYYNDRWPFQPELHMRDLAKPLDNFQGANSNFVSDVAPAAMLALILLVHMTVLQRTAVRQRLQRVSDPIATFFAGACSATLVGGLLVSTFAWGWVGSVILAVVFTLVYLGLLALLGALIEVAVELGKFFLVWIKRKVFTIATWITRVSSWISSLSGRLVSRGLIERIRADTAAQESLFEREQDDQDRRLYEAYLRDRARKRRLRQEPPVADEPYDAPAEPALPVIEAAAMEAQPGAS